MKLGSKILYFLAGALSVTVLVVFAYLNGELFCSSSGRRVREEPVMTVPVVTTAVSDYPARDQYALPPSIGVGKWNSTCSYTIVIQTYRRNDILHRVLAHYCTFCEAHKILVVWNNIGHPVPEVLSNKARNCCPTLLFLEQTRNSIRNRFYPYPEIQTEAILSLDDDLIISRRDVQFGCRVWKKWQHLIVGWLPRKHGQWSNGNRTTYTYYRGLSKGRFAPYSMVLTGEAFIHISYFKMFTHSLPEEVKQMIDTLMNCEDIAMNVMVADVLAKSGHPQCSGLRLQPSSRIRNLEKQSKMGFTGLWRRSDSKDSRGHCLEKLDKIYTSLPLRYSDLMISPNSF